jgi:hypothetical protein
MASLIEEVPSLAHAVATPCVVSTTTIFSGFDYSLLGLQMASYPKSTDDRSLLELPAFLGHELVSEQIFGGYRHV